MPFSKFWNTFPNVSKLTAWISWRIASLNCSIGRGVLLYTLPFNRPKERCRQALDRLPIVSNFLTNFWMQHVDGARLSPNSVRNAVCHALNEPVCQYLRTRNPRYSNVYIDNSLGPLTRDSPCSNRLRISHLLYSPNFCCRLHKNSPLLLVLSQIVPASFLWPVIILLPYNLWLAQILFPFGFSEFPWLF